MTLGIVNLRKEPPAARVKRLRGIVKSVHKQERKATRELERIQRLAVSVEQALKRAKEEVLEKNTIDDWVGTKNRLRAPESWSLTVVKRTPFRDSLRLTGTTPTHHVPFSVPVTLCNEAPTRSNGNCYDNWPGRPEWRTRSRQRSRRPTEEPHYCA
jgi:DNA-binding FrmR family transcriptional regulator